MNRGLWIPRGTLVIPGILWYNDGQKRDVLPGKSKMIQQKERIQ
jgi:hypothetical protein